MTEYLSVVAVSDDDQSVMCTFCGLVQSSFTLYVGVDKYNLCIICCHDNTTIIESIIYI